jgi:hypothetical protein
MFCHLRFEGRILAPAPRFRGDKFTSVEAEVGVIIFRRNDNHQLRYNRTPGSAVNNTEDILQSLSVLLLSGKGLSVLRSGACWFFYASIPNGLGCRGRLI